RSQVSFLIRGAQALLPPSAPIACRPTGTGQARPRAQAGALVSIGIRPTRTCRQARPGAVGMGRSWRQVTPSKSERQRTDRDLSERRGAARAEARLALVWLGVALRGERYAACVSSQTS